jgi:hypothetical protein
MQRVRSLPLPYIILSFSGIAVIVFIVIIIWRLFFQNDAQPGNFGQESLQIIATTPVNNTTNVGIFSPIQFSFSRELTEYELKSFNFTVSPPIQFTEDWGTSDSILTLIPTSPLLTDTTYTITYTSPLSYELTFSTVSIDDISIDDQAKNQSIADKNFEDYWKQVYDSYPWYNQLPLQTENYFVYFDTSKKSFIGILYIETENMNNQQSQSIRKDEIKSRLANLSVPVESTQFEWRIIEKK